MNGAAIVAVHMMSQNAIRSAAGLPPAYMWPENEPLIPRGAWWTLGAMVVAGAILVGVVAYLDPYEDSRYVERKETPIGSVTSVADCHYTSQKHGAYTSCDITLSTGYSWRARITHMPGGYLGVGDTLSIVVFKHETGRYTRWLQRDGHGLMRIKQCDTEAECNS